MIVTQKSQKPQKESLPCREVIIRSRRTEGAARADESLLSVCRVVTEVNTVKLRISQIGPLTSKGMAIEKSHRYHRNQRKSLCLAEK